MKAQKLNKHMVGAKVQAKYHGEVTPVSLLDTNQKDSHNRPFILEKHYSNLNP